jgi:5-(hydroxymethyl)furfural/furfural oxidase
MLPGGARRGRPAELGAAEPSISDESSADRKDAIGSIRALVFKGLHSQVGQSTNRIRCGHSKMMGEGDNVQAKRLWDVIIVGAGAAGCVLASRLSEIEEKQVLLIEAGPDFPAEREPADILDPFGASHANTRYHWPNLVAETGADPGNGQSRTSHPYTQGYGVGGGSNINGMYAFRGLPIDYDRWRASGAAGWGWDDVLPYFTKLERDLDFSGPLHGDRGPIPIRRMKPEDWSPFSSAVSRVLERKGYPRVEDCHADFRDGIMSAPKSNLPNRRVSAAAAYLDRSARRRANLAILPGTLVERLRVRDGCVHGVVVRNTSGAQSISAREVVVTCGGICSPALLMRSGIGPGPHLHRLGIEVVRDLPGVGQHLQNHAFLFFATHLPVMSAALRAFGYICLRYSSCTAGCGSHDMHLAFAHRASWHPLERRIGAIDVMLYEPHSHGSVELVNPDPVVAPRVRFNTLCDSRDFERMASGLRFALEIATDQEVAKVRNELFTPSWKHVANFSRRSRWNWLRSAAITGILDVPVFRHSILGTSVLSPDQLLQDADALHAMVRKHTGVAHHVCCTCKMGGADDPNSVVDETGRVRGIERLRVADASIFPIIPREGMHIPVLMTAEKIADHIKANWRATRGSDHTYRSWPPRQYAPRPDAPYD